MRADEEAILHGSGLLLQQDNKAPAIKLCKQLGKGGFAVVYKADIENIGACALKVLLPVPGKNGDIYTRMFVREAQAGWKLQHPHLVRCDGLVRVGPEQGALPATHTAQASGSSGNAGSTWGQVLEFCGGGTMRSLIARAMAEGRNTYSDAQAYEWLLQVASAVSYLHTCEPPIIHRDIKQENILLAIQHAAPGVAQAASRDASAHGGRASSPTSSSAPCTHAAAAAGVGRMSLTGCGRDSSARGGMHGASRMVAKLADLGLHVVVDVERGALLRQRAHPGTTSFHSAPATAHGTTHAHTVTSARPAHPSPPCAPSAPVSPFLAVSDTASFACELMESHELLALAAAGGSAASRLSSTGAFTSREPSSAVGPGRREGLQLQLTMASSQPARSRSGMMFANGVSRGLGVGVGEIDRMGQASGPFSPLFRPMGQPAGLLLAIEALSSDSIGAAAGSGMHTCYAAGSGPGSCGPGAGSLPCTAPGVSVQGVAGGGMEQARPGGIGQGKVCKDTCAVHDACGGQADPPAAASGHACGSDAGQISLGHVASGGTLQARAEVGVGHVGGGAARGVPAALPPAGRLPLHHSSSTPLHGSMTGNVPSVTWELPHAPHTPDAAKAVQPPGPARDAAAGSAQQAQAQAQPPAIMVNPTAPLPSPGHLHKHAIQLDYPQVAAPVPAPPLCSRQLQVDPVPAAGGGDADAVSVSMQLLIARRSVNGASVQARVGGGGGVMSKFSRFCRMHTQGQGQAQKPVTAPVPGRNLMPLRRGSAPGCTTATRTRPLTTASAGHVLAILGARGRHAMSQAGRDSGSCSMQAANASSTIDRSSKGSTVSGHGSQTDTLQMQAADSGCGSCPAAGSGDDDEVDEQGTGSDAHGDDDAHGRMHSTESAGGIAAALSPTTQAVLQHRLRSLAGSLRPVRASSFVGGMKRIHSLLWHMGRSALPQLPPLPTHAGMSQPPAAAGSSPADPTASTSTGGSDSGTGGHVTAVPSCEGGAGVGWGDDPACLAWVYGLTGKAGSALYMAPEVLTKLPYNEKVDVFSFGVLAYELLSRTLLLHTYIGTPAGSALGMRRPDDYAERVCGGWRPPCPSRMQPGAWELISRCWADDPLARPCMEDVVHGLMQLHAGAQQAAAEAKDSKASGKRWLRLGPSLRCSAAGGQQQVGSPSPDGAGSEASTGRLHMHTPRGHSAVPAESAAGDVCISRSAAAAAAASVLGRGAAGSEAHAPACCACIIA